MDPRGGGAQRGHTWVLGVDDEAGMQDADIMRADVVPSMAGAGGLPRVPAGCVDRRGSGAYGAGDAGVGRHEAARL